MRLEVIKQIPKTAPKPLPLLFVHGAWHGAWCWDEEFLPYFASHRYDAYALSLRGHGNSEGGDNLRWYSAANYVEDVARVADTITREHRRRPVIIGHSMGGYITQKFLEKHTASGAVLLASVPASGAFAFSLRHLFKYPSSMFTAALRLDPYQLIADKEQARTMFFASDLPYHRLERYHEQLNSESVRILLDACLLNLPRPKRINNTPMLVIGAEKDTIFTAQEIERTAQAYGTTAHIIPDTAHDIMLEANWQQAADIMLNWLETLVSAQ